jgi:hypothetical protein
MYTNQEIAILDKLNFPFDYAVKGMAYKTGSEILELRKKYKGSQKNFRSKVEKNDRIEFYTLQVENGERIEFQENEMKLLPRQLQFVELYERITDTEI